MQSSTAQVGIARPWREVCSFLAQPLQYARWALWIGASLREHEGEWTVRLPRGGRAKLRFSEPNAFGVADHWLVRDEERSVFVALRALPNDDGCEVLLTFFREDGISKAEWNERQPAMQASLHALKHLLEARAAAPAQRRSSEGAADAENSAAKSRLRIALTATSQRPSAQRPCTPASS